MATSLADLYGSPIMRENSPGAAAPVPADAWDRLFYNEMPTVMTSITEGGEQSAPYTGGGWGALTAALPEWQKLDPSIWHALREKQGGEFASGGNIENIYGSRSGVFNNGDGTFTVKRGAGGFDPSKAGDKYAYQQAQYKLVTDPDGTKRLERTGDWQNYSEQSSWMQSGGPDLLKFLGVAALGGLGTAALGGALGGTAGATGTGAATAAGGAAGPGLTLGGVSAGGAASPYALSGSLGAGGAGAVGLTGTGSGFGLAGAGTLGASLPSSAAITGGLGAGIGSTLPAVGASALSPAVLGGSFGGGSATTNALQRMFGSGGGSNIGSLLGNALALGGAVGAATSGDGVSLPGQNAGLGDLAGKVGGIADQQYALAQQRQAMLDPVFQQVIAQQMGEASKNIARGDQQWQHYLDTFLPAERRMAETAANYDTAGRRKAAGEEAVAGVNAQLDAQRQGMLRELGRAGVSLSSGRALSLDDAARYSGAKAAAGADRAARNQVEQTGIALTNNVANFGRGVAGTGLNAAQLGVQTGNSATGNAQGQQAAFNAALAPASNFYSAAGSLANAQAGNQIDLARLQLAQQQMKQGGYAGLGSLAGTLLGSQAGQKLVGGLGDFVGGLFRG